MAVLPETHGVSGQSQVYLVTFERLLLGCMFIMLQSLHTHWCSEDTSRGVEFPSEKPHGGRRGGRQATSRMG